MIKVAKHRNSAISTAVSAPPKMPSQTFWVQALNSTPPSDAVSIMASAAMFSRPACCEMVEQIDTKISGVAMRIRE